MCSQHAERQSFSRPGRQGMANATPDNDAERPGPEKRAALGPAPHLRGGRRRIDGDKLSGANADRMSHWMRSHRPDFPAISHIEPLPGSASHRTCRVIAADRAYAMRHDADVLEPSSRKAVVREFRVLEALALAGFPAPRPIVLCDDASVGGAHFYLREMIDGRIYGEDSLAGLAPPERRRLYETLVDTIAELHSIDPEAPGLEHSGASGNNLKRQIDFWTSTYRAAQTDAIAELEALIDWLPRTVPWPERPAIVHGDFRIDNILFAHDEPRLRGVIGWEMASTGDPLADFAHFAIPWIMPSDSGNGLADGDLERAGAPSLSELVARYCDRTERRHVPDLHWHFAFSLFRFAVILQTRKRRSEGEALAAGDPAKDSRIGGAAKLGWRQALRACARRSA